MESEKIQFLKNELLEDKFPYFSDEMLEHLYKSSFNELDFAVYNGLLKKARNDFIKLPSGLEKQSNRDFWNALAVEQMQKILANVKLGKYNQELTNYLKIFSMSSSSGSFRLMKRADEI